ncbi:MAG TPA: MBL fold metallo-hydrolase [Candidatus Acidoferrales bacterium]|nr:MBL fold metallo-hydrolase [Candidatus Acidoferrales bacterium]
MKRSLLCKPKRCGPASRHFLSAAAIAVAALAVSLLAPAASAQRAQGQSAQQPLQIYFVDVEGGQSTLFVTPAHQSLLIDAGWNDHNGRDAERILAVAKMAGVSKLDYVLITHFHEDHVGGVPNLVARIPVGTFIDHGVNYEVTDAATVKVWNAYRPIIATGKYKHIVPKPGDVLPIAGIHAQVISSDGVLLSKPLPGAGQDNTAACKASEQRPPDQTENGHSLGTLLTFGKLRFLDLGDLTWDKEMLLTCPVNKIGKVDVYIVSHHGWYKSSSPALLHGISPRVAVMDNGSDKGGTPSAWDIIEKTPGLENLWQLHYSDEGGPAHNVAAEFIANPPGPDGGHYLKLTAWPNGTFEIYNSRTQKTKLYPAR